MADEGARTMVGQGTPTLPCRSDRPDVEVVRLARLADLARLGRQQGLDVWASSGCASLPQQQAAEVAALLAECSLPPNSPPGHLGRIANVAQLGVVWAKNNRPIAHLDVLLAAECNGHNQRALGVGRALSDAARLEPHMERLVATDLATGTFIDVAASIERAYGRHMDWISLAEVDRLLGRPAVEVNLPPPAQAVVETAVVRENLLYGRFCRLVLEAPAVASRVSAGQFLQVACADRPSTGGLSSPVSPWELRGRRLPSLGERHLIDIPLSIHRIYHEGFDPRSLARPHSLPPAIRAIRRGGARRIIDLVFEVVGAGTERLSRLERGQGVQIIGPLGKPLFASVGGERLPGTMDVEAVGAALLVGGGMGIAPLYPVAETLRWHGIAAQLLAGTRRAEDLDVGDGFLLREFSEMGCSVARCSEDVDARLVTDLLADRLAERGGAALAVFACGPDPMLKAVALSCRQHGVPCRVFMAPRMACGIGACGSCVCKTRAAGKTDGGWSYARACVDGPVFDAEALVWE